MAVLAAAVRCRAAAAPPAVADEGARQAPRLALRRASFGARRFGGASAVVYGGPLDGDVEGASEAQIEGGVPVRAHDQVADCPQLHR